jgi:Tol biopolymer transport system component
VIQWKALDGSGQEEVLLQRDSPLWPWFWTRDGKHMLFQSLNPATGDDLWIMAMEGDRTPRPLLNSQFSEEWAQVSPDGKWVAYNSDESGRPEVYVAPFPAMGSKARVSTEGGVHPQWAPNGKELYYRIGSSVEMQRSLEQRVKLMAVPVETSPVFKAGTAHKLFEGPFFDSGHDYAVTPDGKGFIFIRESGPASSASTVKVVVNWFEELKRKMPAN